MGELHLENHRRSDAARVQSRRQYRQAAGCYREDYQTAAEAEGKLVPRAGGHGQYAVVELRIEPLAKASASSSKTAPRAARSRATLFRQSKPGQRGDGKRRARRLSDGRYQGHRGSTQGTRRRLVRTRVQNCGLDGVQRGLRKSRAVLLEPIMEVEVVTPQEFMGEVIGT